MNNIWHYWLFFACTILYMYAGQLYAQPQQPPIYNNSADTTAVAIDYYQPQTLRYENAVYRESIGSVIFRVKGLELSDPFLQLPPKRTIAPPPAVLELTFDEFGNTANYYSYKIVHCSADWQPSRLDPFDYIDGFLRDDIVNYAYSFNSVQPYVNYRLEIPNNNMRPTVSGNYLLKVYANDNEEDLVLTRRFVIYENMLRVEIKALPTSISAYFETHQRLEFEVAYSQQDFSVGNPLLDFYTTVLQNGRWDNALQDIKPTFLHNDAMIFSSMDQTLFAGGNEFRFFDTRCLQTKCSNVLRIERDKKNTADPNYHVWLYPDKMADRHRRYRLGGYDLNGKFYIGIDSRFNFNLLDADYVYTHFALSLDKPIGDEGNIYIFGALSDWQTKPEFMMHYNPKTQNYEGTVFLKQGLYDYQYVWQKDGKALPDASKLEGSYAAAENTYTVIVYQHLPNKRYDRVVGFLTIQVNR